MFQQNVATIHDEAGVMKSALGTWLPANLGHIVVEYASSILMFERFKKILDTLCGRYCPRHTHNTSQGIMICWGFGSSDWYLHSAIKVQRRGDSVDLTIEKELGGRYAVSVPVTMFWDWLAGDAFPLVFRAHSSPDVPLERVRDVLRAYFNTAHSATA